MARIGRLGFLGVAVVFHLVYLFSIFDIYFVSPIVSGMSAYKVEQDIAPAKRLVLYVGDGLRADKAFQFFPDPSPGASGPEAEVPRPLAPFLRSKILETGTFGVSHTRVPTESRPGHVAMIAGLYEDVSAVTTGWKLNPVNFDSVFNRSTHTWSWGSPDILPMFSHGATPGRVTDDTYGGEFEDFSKDAKELDYWVFEHVKDFFNQAVTNTELSQHLQQSGNVFFLHLLGLDTTGHSYRPYSKEYLHNIQIVDEGVRRTTELIDRFFGDGETAYIFTADHGMSDWGSHGDGHPDNTRTPLVAWGAGIAPPVKSPGAIAAGHEDGFSSDWQLDHIQRNDVAQADIAPLMAYLVGLEFPVNSVGELPLSFLSAGDEDKAKAMLVNAREVLEMYRVKEEQKLATVVRYRPFPDFAEITIDDQIAEIQQLIDAQRYSEAIEASDRLLQVGLRALRYLQTYNWLFLRTLVTIGYLGWVAFAFTTAVDVYVVDSSIQPDRSSTNLAAFAGVLVALYGFLAVQSSPFSYYLYSIFPIVFWEEVWAHREALIAGQRILFAKLSKADLTKTGLNVLAYLGILEIMAQSYYHREIYSIAYLLAIAWPLSYGTSFVKEHKQLCAIWAAACASMSAFTILPANKIESAVLIQLGGLLTLVVGILFIIFEDYLLQIVPSPERTNTTNVDLSRLILGLQVGLVALAMAVTYSSVSSLQAKQGLPLGTQVVGWFTLISSFVLPFLHTLQPRNHYLHRLAVIFLAFGPLFIILTISYEGLFYIAIGFTFLTWVRLEHEVQQSNMLKPAPDTVDPLAIAARAAKQRDIALKTGDYRALTISDARISLFFLYLLQSAFFSTGNIASVSSFSLDAVYRLIPIFDPFSQGALLLLKLLAPFALLSANLGILTKRLRLQGGSLFAVVLGISDYLTLRFFWEVRDEGSWLEIGESISMFVIVSLLCVFVAGLEALSEVLIRGVHFENDVQSGDGPQEKVNGEVKPAPST